MRADLADVALAQRVFAPHYAAALMRTVLARADLRADRNADSDVVSEILPGEPFAVLEIVRDRAWGRSPVDGAVGYVPLAALGGPADVESEAASGGERDYVSIAESLIGVPAKPGGRSDAGLNCSGLIFLALRRAGIAAPRFCDLQAAELGAALNENEPLRRGDLIFFADHAAIMIDEGNLVHVGEVRVERAALADVAASGRYGPVVARRRIAS